MSPGRGSVDSKGGTVRVVLRAAGYCAPFYVGKPDEGREQA